MLFVQDVWLEMINEFAKVMERVAAAIDTGPRSFGDLDPRPVMSVKVEHDAEGKVAAAFVAQVSLPPIFSSTVKFEIRVGTPGPEDTNYLQRIQVTYRSDFYRNPAANRLHAEEYVITKDAMRMRTREDLQVLARELALHCATPYLAEDMKLPVHAAVQAHLSTIYQ